MTLWMLVDLKHQELPLYVANTVQELADHCQVTVNAVNSAVWHAKKNGRRCRYVKVEIKEDENERD